MPSARRVGSDVLVEPERVRFDLTDQARQNRYRMLFEPAHAEVCLTHPGHREDLIVTTTSEWLAKWHMGWISLPAAQRRAVITVTGPPPLTLGTLGRSRFSGVKPARQSADTPLGAAPRGPVRAVTPAPVVDDRG